MMGTQSTQKKKEDRYGGDKCYLYRIDGYGCAGGVTYNNVVFRFFIRVME